MIDTQIHISQISENIKRFIDIVGKRFWIKRIQLIEDELRGNSDLKEFLVQENVYAYKLQALTHELEKFGIIRRKIRLNKSFYPVYALAIQFLSLYDKFPEVGKRNILRRIQSSFNNLSELRALHLTPIYQGQKLIFVKLLTMLYSIKMTSRERALISNV